MIFDTKIRVNTKAKTAPSRQETIFQYENSAKGRGTEDYTALAMEFLERLGIGLEEEQKVAANG